MLKILLDGNDFAYDIQALCKAFYGKEQIVLEEFTSNENDFLGAIESIKRELHLQVNAEIKVGIVLRQTKLYVYGETKENKIEESVDDMEKLQQKDRRVQYKNIIKRELYKVLSKLSGKKLEWGTLTGVRPSKLILDRLELNQREENIIASMRKHYLCSDEKINLGMAIAKRELELLKKVEYSKGYSVYIGIPFCPSKCLYCSFPSYPLEQFGHYMDSYLQALFLEIEYGASCIQNKKLTSIYVGGGTPTTLNERQLEELMIKIHSVFPVHTIKEFTVEAGRPDSISKEKLEILKRYGVTRISINPQTMNQETLERIGRRHSVKEVIDAYYMAREVGHNNINMDLIAGLPGEELSDMEITLREIKKLNPDSVTVHSLVVKRAADLNIQYSGNFSMNDTTQMLRTSGVFLGNLGYEPYYMYRQKNATGSGINIQENIGYAKAGKEGIYNILIMEEKQTILALGAGGASKFVFPEQKKLVRVENVKSVKDYIERISHMIKRKADFLNENSGIF